MTLAGKFTENQQTGHQGDNQKVEDSKPKPQLVIRILTSTNQKDPNGTQCTSKQKQCTSKQKQGWVGISFSDSLELNSVLCAKFIMQFVVSKKANQGLELHC